MRTAERVMFGAIAGTLATVAMTQVMKRGKRTLPTLERYPLPPRVIVETFAHRTGLQGRVHNEDKAKLTVAAHYGYGAACGGLYGLTRPFLPGPGFVNGPVFGLAVWAGSYLGWLPAADVPVAATKEPVKRSLLMILAHLVWGTVTGSSFELVDHEIEPARRDRPSEPALPRPTLYQRPPHVGRYI